jgi:hypothetical protein
MKITHEDKIAFHNAIVGMASRYAEIAGGFKGIASELCGQECKDLTEQRMREILDSLPSCDVDKEEAAVEVFLQRFFS